MLADCFAPVCTLVGKTWALHLEKVVRVDREENLRDDRRVGRLPRRRRASASSTTPSTSSTASRDDPDYALQLPARRRRGGRRDASCLCDTNGGIAARPGRRGDGRGRAPRSATGVRVGIHCHNDAGCGVANSLAGGRGRRDAGAGHDQRLGERCGNANLVTIIANLQLKLGHDVRRAEQLAQLTETAHFVDELLNLTPDPDQPYVGSNAFAHKGGMHVAGVQRRRRRRSSTSTRRWSATRRELLVSELSGKGTVARAGRGGRARARRRAPPRASSSASRSSSTRGYHFEAADGSFELLLRKEAGEYEPLFRLESWRVIVEKRADGKVETEATIKIWVDGERYVRTAEGNGPVNALDKRAARRDRRDPPAPARHRARQLQGPHPRRDARAPARSRACCSTPPTATTCGARSASPRTSSRPPGRRSSTRSSTAMQPAAPAVRRGRGAGAGA